MTIVCFLIHHPLKTKHKTERPGTPIPRSFFLYLLWKMEMMSGEDEFVVLSLLKNKMWNVNTASICSWKQAKSFTFWWRSCGIIPIASSCVSWCHDTHTQKHTTHTSHYIVSIQMMPSEKKGLVSPGATDIGRAHGQIVFLWSVCFITLRWFWVAK